MVVLIGFIGKLYLVSEKTKVNMITQAYMVLLRIHIIRVGKLIIYFITDRISTNVNWTMMLLPKLNHWLYEGLLGEKEVEKTK